MLLELIATYCGLLLIPVLLLLLARDDDRRIMALMLFGLILLPLVLLWTVFVFSSAVLALSTGSGSWWGAVKQFTRGMSPIFIFVMVSSFIAYFANKLSSWKIKRIEAKG